MSDDRAPGPWTGERDGGPPGARPAGVRSAVAGLHLGRWDEARGRLLPRLVDRRRAGPLHRSIGGRAPTGDDGAVALDLGLDVPGGIVRVDRELVRAWAVDPDRAWSAARRNAARLPAPKPVGALAVGGTDPSDPGRAGTGIAVLAGGPWATASLVVPRRLTGSGSALVVAPAPDLLLVVDGPAAGAGDRVAEETLALAARLAAHRPDRLPLVPLRLDVDGSFIDQAILE